MKLGFLNLSFRDNIKKIDDDNRGNFLVAINILAMYDLILSELLQRGQKKVNYLSITIQNEVNDISEKCMNKSHTIFENEV